MSTRRESDSLGDVEVPEDALWGAQTQRSLSNFPIGDQRMPTRLLRALVLCKKACARSNVALGALEAPLGRLIETVCDELLAGAHADQFPLSVWQTGSGTQTNMNVNEVIANRAAQLAGAPVGCKTPVHPNDHVNCSQSSNDVFPTAMHVAAVAAVDEELLPGVDRLLAALDAQAAAYADAITIGRTHLMDATPMTSGQQFGAMASQLRMARAAIAEALPPLHRLALGATAVGTGLNTPPGWSERVAADIAELTGRPFRSADDKCAALAGHEPLLQLSGAMRLLATTLLKIANDLRWLASGPRCGLAELQLPANEPGSSIMPGKVNPTQAEALSMVAVQVMGLDQAVAIAGSQGTLQLNVYKPLVIANVLTMTRLLGDACDSFARRCVEGLRVDTQRTRALVDNSLMLVTALAPHIGYDRAAKIAGHAHEHGCSLREAALALGDASEAELDAWLDPRPMAGLS
jgi:fumarate hydratase class II